MIDVYAVVKKLIGFIGPIGETNTDDIRFKNLEQTAELVNRLLTDMDNVVMDNKHTQEYSRVRARKFVEKFFNDIGIKE